MQFIPEKLSDRLPTAAKLDRNRSLNNLNDPYSISYNSQSNFNLAKYLPRTHSENTLFNRVLAGHIESHSLSPPLSLNSNSYSSNYLNSNNHSIMDTQRFELKWTGDFTVPRYRAALSKFADLPIKMNDYSDVFNYDRGGKSGVPFSVHSQVPPPRTDSLPTLLKMEQGSSRFTSKNRSRLPIIPPRLKTIKKAQSCVFLRTPFVGKFGTEEVDAAPDLRTSRKAPVPDKKPGGFSSEEEGDSKKETPERIIASRKMWRVSATADTYFKEAEKSDPDLKTTQVPQIENAIKEGALVDWKNPDSDGMTLFTRAASTNNLDLCRYLSQNHNADPLILDNMNRNVFHHMALQNAFVVQTWLSRNTPNLAPFLSGKDNDGDTPLHKAAQSGASVCAELLLRGGKGKDMVKVINNDGEIPYEVAKRYKMHHLLKLLDPLEYVKDQTSLIYRMKGGGDKDEGDDDEGDEDEDGEDEEGDDDGGAGEPGAKKKFKNLLKMDRKCNQAAAEKVLGKKEKKGKKGKKGKKKK